MRWRMFVIAISSCLVPFAFSGVNESAARAALQRANPDARVLLDGQRVNRVFGAPLSFGTSPQESAANFLQQHAPALGVSSAELRAGSNFTGLPTVPLMPDAGRGGNKFTLVYFAQEKDGIPVFRGEVRLLTRNEPGFPVVLVASSARNLGEFVVDRGVAAKPFDRLEQIAPEMTNYSDIQVVIWAGIDDAQVEPVLAITFTADNYDNPNAKPERWLYVADAVTGNVLYKENLIRFAPITGHVQGMATEGAKADICSPELVTVMAWARVSVTGGGTGYADGEGNFSIPHSGSSPVTVQSFMTGTYFSVDNWAGAEETLSATVTPGVPYTFTHNEENISDLVRSQVNCYVSANRVRDWILAQNPGFPGISTETNFPIYVNRTDGYCPCNAWSDGISINFCQAGGGCPNTGWQSVLDHEYGHHVIDQGGSGQGAYGEGMSDCIAVLTVDDPNLGYGFFGNCDAGLRTADNDCQYLASGCSTCGSEEHDCGNLLSGCIWSIRNELIVTEPDEYLSILSSLTVNSILLHLGTSINDDIVIDFLTLDDDDGYLGNGSPHYNEICAGFTAHGLSCPELLTGIRVTPETGFQSEGHVGGPFISSCVYVVHNIGTYDVGYSVTCPENWISIPNGSGTLPAGASTLVTVSINSQAANLPMGVHHATVSFENTTDSTGNTTRGVELAVGYGTAYSWNLDTDPGWSTQGQWAWGIPAGGGGGGGGPDPTSGHTGRNVYGYNLNGDYTNNMPEYHLTTPPIDCQGLTDVHLRFSRWLGVEKSIYDHAYVRVSNNGTTWTNVWQNGAADVADSSWTLQDIDISSLADNQPNVRIRWTMGTTDVGLTFCGWNIDDVAIFAAGDFTLPPLVLSLPLAPPSIVPALTPTPLTLHISNAGETYVPGSARLYYRFAPGAFSETTLTSLGDDLYRAVLPAAPCGVQPEFYFSATGSGGATVILPENAPTELYRVGVGTLTTIVFDDFEVASGWTVGDTGDDASIGIWDRADPNPTAAQPGSDHTPEPGVMCWVTDSRGGSLGSYDVDGGKTTLKSPNYDLSGSTYAVIGYWRWYSNDQGATPHTDVFVVDISDDGGSTWVNAETVGPGGPQTSPGWFYHEFNVQDFVALTNQVRLRFIASDEGEGSLVEAALDDFSIVTLSCDDSWQPGDLNCDGSINVFDIDPFVLALTDSGGYGTAYPGCNYMLADVNGDGSVNVFDIDPFVLVLTGG